MISYKIDAVSSILFLYWVVRIIGSRTNDWNCNDFTFMPTNISREVVDRLLILFNKPVEYQNTILLYWCQFSWIVHSQPEAYWQATSLGNPKFTVRKNDDLYGSKMYQYLVGFTSSIKISPFFYIHAQQNILTYIDKFSATHGIKLIGNSDLLDERLIVLS